MENNTWDPNIYLLNAGLRTRPAVDLAERVPLTAPDSIIDLGCGPGNSTEILRKKWASAHISGLDSSSEMIDRAKTSDTNTEWQVGTIQDWKPAAPLDLIFANASLHWVPDHGTLFTGLFSHLAADGVLAVQMPNNFNAYSHTNIVDSLNSTGLYNKMAGKLLGDAVQAPEFYHNLLRDKASHLDIWETEYMQVLTGEDPVYKWVEATTLLPLKTHLSNDEFREFSMDYKVELRNSYPMQNDGVTLYPFRRIFIIARN